jgi:hypothetical protein
VVRRGRKKCRHRKFDKTVAGSNRYSKKTVLKEGRIIKTCYIRSGY